MIDYKYIDDYRIKKIIKYPIFERKDDISIDNYSRSRILREKNAAWKTETAFETVNIEVPCLNQSLTKL